MRSNVKRRHTLPILTSFGKEKKSQDEKRTSFYGGSPEKKNLGQVRPIVGTEGSGQARLKNLTEATMGYIS